MHESVLPTSIASSNFKNEGFTRVLDDGKSKMHVDCSESEMCIVKSVFTFKVAIWEKLSVTDHCSV